MTILSPALKIKPPLWMRDPDLIKILDFLNKDSLVARMVGGCIRNYFFDDAVEDIDIACALSPQGTKDILNRHSIRVIDTGIDHGTITAHINGKNFEITQLRQDIATDGRHATVEPTDDWVKDAQRRDFTMNALYADRDGSIYDPLGTGLNDIENRIVRFIGDPHQRIEEDRLRILRFFRFFARYNKGDPDKESFKACINLKESIHTLSHERIYDELFKILSNHRAFVAFEQMHRAGILGISKDVIEPLTSLILYQNQLEFSDVLTRYAISKIDRIYIKNKKQNTFIDALDDFQNHWDGTLKKSLYLYDRNIVIQGLLMLKAQDKDTVDDALLTRAINDKIPEFPIIAADVMDYFKISEGPDVGKRMKQAEKIWIDSGFNLSREDILRQTETMGSSF